MENYFESVTKEVFGEEFKCKVTSDIIYLISKNDGYGFQFIMSKYDYQRVFRENFCVFKKFDEVERIIIPLCIKHGVLYTQYTKFTPTIQTYPKFLEIPNINHTFFRKRTMVHVNNREAIYAVMNELKAVVEFEKTNFINKYSTVKEVCQKLLPATPRERGEMVCGPGPIKWLYIQYLFNGDKIDFIKKAHDLINEVAEIKDSSIFNNYDKVLNDMIAIVGDNPCCAKDISFVRVKCGL